MVNIAIIKNPQTRSPQSLLAPIMDAEPEHPRLSTSSQEEAEEIRKERQERWEMEEEREESEEEHGKMEEEVEEANDCKEALRKLIEDVVDTHSKVPDTYNQQEVEVEFERTQVTMIFVYHYVQSTSATEIV